MLSRREAAFLSVARYLAAKSKSRKKHGAVLVRSGRVVGTGYNRERNSPFVVSPEHIKPHRKRRLVASVCGEFLISSKGRF